MNNVTMMNYNKGKKLLSERFYLTWAGEQMSWTDELDGTNDDEDARCR